LVIIEKIFTSNPYEFDMNKSQKTVFREGDIGNYV